MFSFFSFTHEFKRHRYIGIYVAYTTHDETSDIKGYYCAHTPYSIKLSFHPHSKLFRFMDYFLLPSSNTIVDWQTTETLVHLFYKIILQSSCRLTWLILRASRNNLSCLCHSNFWLARTMLSEYSVFASFLQSNKNRRLSVTMIWGTSRYFWCLLLSSLKLQNWLVPLV